MVGISYITINIALLRAGFGMFGVGKSKQPHESPKGPPYQIMALGSPG